MSFLIRFLISFVIVYLLYFVFVVLNKKKKNSIYDTRQASILINLNKLDVKKIDKNLFIQSLIISNSIILSFTFTFAISHFFKNFILNMMASFLIMLILIVVLYKIVGIILNKKEGI